MRLPNLRPLLIRDLLVFFVMAMIGIDLFYQYDPLVNYLRHRLLDYATSQSRVC